MNYDIIFLVDEIQGMQIAATQFTKATGQKRKSSSAELVEELKVKSVWFIKPHSAYGDCSPDDLEKVFNCALANGYFEDNPTLGFELV